MHPLAQLDHLYLWHPFTQMRDWLKSEPIVITRGHGAVLQDARGRKYLDANSSIWTNLHGHNHPTINAAIERQLKKIAHSSALGFASEPASLLAEKLVQAANPLLVQRASGLRPRGSALVPEPAAGSEPNPGGERPALRKVFFSDDGATAMCNWECVGKVERKFAAQKGKRDPYAAMVVEPLVQGAAGMTPQPPGWLRRVAEIARGHGAQLIADEVMTGFGRTGFPSASRSADPGPAEDSGPEKSRQTGPLGFPAPSLFACHHEGVQPDFLALAKGLTGGYLPMAATLTTQEVFDAFLGEYEEFKTFFHGHSFTGNQLGSAAALASLEILQGPASIQARNRLEQTLRSELPSLWRLPNVGDIRQIGLVAGVELVKNWRTREGFDLRERAGPRVCEAMARRGVLTRPIGNVVVLMPPYATTPRQASRMVAALFESVEEKLGGKRSF